MTAGRFGWHTHIIFSKEQQVNTTLTQNKTVSVGRLAVWSIASAIGIVVGFMATLPLIWSISENLMNTMPQIAVQIFGGAFFGIGFGLAVGLAQWLVLRTRDEPHTRWIAASVIGGLIGGIAGIWFSATFNDGGTNTLLTAVTFALLGGIVGAVQFLMMRAVAKNILWIAASAVGLGIGAAIPFGAENLQVISVAIAGLIYGALTATVMWRFSKN